MTEAEVKKTIKNLVYDLPQYRQAVDDGDVTKEDLLKDIEIVIEEINDAIEDIDADTVSITDLNYEFDYFVQSYLDHIGVVDYSETNKRVEPYETVALMFMFNKGLVPALDVIDLPEDDTPVDYRILSGSSSGDEEDTGATMTRAEVEKQEYHERMRDQVTVDATSPDSHERREKEPRW